MRPGSQPEPEADRYRLIRRLSLDLIGLPPTIEEVDAFVHDDRPDAYERLVDRLLASPAYGEHWARKWLDLARYADTTGYEKDSMRKIWPFRDWVINALNADMPFDQFTIEQLAGDLLPNATKDQIIATAFHRNTMQNDEGGADDEEYRVAAVIDRVNTTMQVWMGTTMGCCQCHSHKYDPFSHREYYELFAFFNQTADADRYDQEPLLLTPDATSSKKLKAELDRQLEESKREYDTRMPMSLADAQREWEQRVVAGDWLEAAAAGTGDFARRCDVHGSRRWIGARFRRTSGHRHVHDPAETELNAITAVRLEALPHESLPRGGPGRADDGGFVVSKVEVFQEPIRAGREREVRPRRAAAARLSHDVRSAGVSRRRKCRPWRDGDPIEHGVRRSREAGDRRQHASPFCHRPVDLAHGVQRQPLVGSRSGATRRASIASCCGMRKGIRSDWLVARDFAARSEAKAGLAADAAVFARPDCHVDASTMRLTPQIAWAGADSERKEFPAMPRD